MNYESRIIINNFVKFIIVLFMCLIFYSLFLFSVASAASLYFEPIIEDIGIGQFFSVNLVLDAEGEDINAIEGIVKFPAELLILSEIREGNSIISLWVEKPITQSNNSIIFSGIIPGGFRGVLSPYYEGYQPGKVFSLIFKTRKSGQGKVSLGKIGVLLNDGLGTSAKLSKTPLKLEISDNQAQNKPKILIFEDKTPPENITAEINKDESIFNNQYFLVFNAQDKDSGIHHYEIKESKKKNKGKWIEAESPYLLVDQNLKSYIYIKAIDKYGNSKTITLNPINKKSWYEKYLNWAIIIIAFSILYWGRRYKLNL